MTKSELIDHIAARTDLPVRDVHAIVEALLGAVTQQLADGGRVEIRGFGSFSTRRRPPRVGRNPSTGASVSVPEKRVPVFRASRILSVDTVTAKETMADLDPIDYNKGAAVLCAPGDFETADLA